jgi:death on curing protein
MIVWLEKGLVRAVHDRQVAEHGGSAGVRDEGLLESALARPGKAWSYDPSVDLAGLAAEYAFGLARNHAFLDGNKRIAFVAANIFLMLNGLEIEAPEPAVVDAMLRVADGRLEREALAANGDHAASAAEAMVARQSPRQQALHQRPVRHHGDVPLAAPGNRPLLDVALQHVVRRLIGR